MNGRQNERAPKWTGAKMNGCQNERASKWTGAKPNGRQNERATKWTGAKMNDVCNWLENELSLVWAASETFAMILKWDSCSLEPLDLSLLSIKRFRDIPHSMSKGHRLHWTYVECGLLQ